MQVYYNIRARFDGRKAEADARRFQSQIAASQKAMGRFGSAFSLSNMEKFGKNLQWTGRQLEYNFTLPILLAGGAATKFALDNEAAQVKLRKVYGSVGEDQQKLKKETDALNRSFELMSSRYGVLQKDVIDIGTAWAQAGAEGVAVANATRLTLDLMILGEMDAIEAQEGLLAVQAAYRLNTVQLGKALGVLNMVENETSINLTGLIEVIQRAGGVARTAGIDLRHLAAMASTLVPASGSATQAGNSLRTLISRIMVPTEEAAEVMEKFGINIMDASWQAKNGVQRMLTMSKAFDGLTKAQRTQASSMVASRWQINRFDILMEDLYLSTKKNTRAQSTYARSLDQTAKASDVARQYAKELSIALASDSRSVSILWRTLQNALAKAIAPMIPVIIGLLAEITKMVNWFGELDPTIQKVVLSFLLLVALVGPITRYFGAFILLGTRLAGAFLFLTHMIFGHAAAQEISAAATATNTEVMVVQHGLLYRLGAAFKWLGSLMLLPFSVVKKGFDFIFQGISLGLRGAMQIPVGTFLGQFVAFPFRAVGAAFGGIWTLFTKGATLALDAAGTFATYLLRTVLPAVAGAVPRMVAGMARGVLAAADMAGAAIVGLWNLSSTAFSAMMSSMGAMLLRPFQMIGGLIASGWSALMTGITGIASSAASGIMSIFSGIGTFIATIPTRIGLAWISFMEWLPTAMAAAGRFLLGPWGLAITAAIALVLAFKDEIWAAVQNIGEYFQNLPEWMVKPFQNAVQWIIDAFHKLPESIQSSLISVVNMVKTVALQVYEWLSYLNPFAEHSPSLVDQVREGVATILSEYQNLAHIEGILQGAIAAHNAFLEATGAQADRAQLGDYMQQRKVITKIAPDAGPAVDAMIAKIFELEGALKAVGIEVQKQQTLVDGMRASIEAAMGPINDKISANELAQKKLRLEMLKMQRAGKDIDALRDKYAALGGQIEMLRGKREDMRLAGAGSDVLKTYDDQISKLEKQRNALEGIKDPLSKLQDQMDALATQGEILQLRRDIKFDPQLEALANQEDKLQDLQSAYSDIEGTIRDMEAALQDFASTAERILDKRKAKKKDKAGGDQSFGLDLFDAAGKGDWKLPGGHSVPGLGREGGLAEIEDFNAQMERKLQRALDNMGGFDLLGPFKDMWNAAWGWLKDNVGPYITPIIDKIKEWWNSIDWSGMNGEGLKNFLDNVGEWFSQLWTRLKSSPLGGWFQGLETIFQGFSDAVTFLWDNIKPTIGMLTGMFLNAWHKIGDELRNWVPVINKFIEAFGHVFKQVVNFVVKPVLAALYSIWKITWPAIRRVVETVWDFITGIIRGAMKAIRSAIEFFLDIINGDWKMAWDDVKEFVRATWDTIYELISAPIRIIIDAVHGLVEGIVDFFQMLYDKLVGHSIVPDLINGIIYWFKLLTAPIKWVMQQISKVIHWLFDNVIKPVWDAIITYGDDVLVVGFRAIKKIISTIWHALGKVFGWVWRNVIKPVWAGIKIYWNQVLKPAFQIMKKVIGSIWSAIGGGIKWVWRNVIKPAWAAIKFYWTNVLKPAFKIMGDVVEEVWDAIGGAIKWAWRNIIKPAWEAIKFYWRNVFKPVWDAMKTSIDNIWDAIGTAIKWTWDHVIKPIFSAIKWVWRDLIKPGWDAMKNALGTAWDWVGTKIENVYNNVIKPIFQAIKGVWGFVKDGFTNFKDGVGEAFDWIWEKIKGVTNSIIGAVNAITGGINTVTGLIPFIDIPEIPKIPELHAEGGVITHELAAGGRLHKRIKESDAFVRAGFVTNRPRAIVGEGSPFWPEYVIPTDPRHRGNAHKLLSEAQAKIGTGMYAQGGVIGNHAAQQFFMENRAPESGFSLNPVDWGKAAIGAFRKGAVTAALAGPLKAMDGLINAIPWPMMRDILFGLKNRFYDWAKGVDETIGVDAPSRASIDAAIASGQGTIGMIIDYMNSTGIPYRVASDYRPGSITATGNASYHGMHRAVDFAAASGPSYDSPELLAINHAWLPIAKELKELIYSGPGAVEIHNGQPHDYTGITHSMHHDHVHVAMASGGYIPTLHELGLANGGIIRRAAGGTLLRVGEGHENERIQVLPLRGDDEGGGDTYIFEGDLIFPGITSGDDADKFLKNLKSLAGK